MSADILREGEGGIVAKIVQAVNPVVNEKMPQTG